LNNKCKRGIYLYIRQVGGWSRIKNGQGWRRYSLYKILLIEFIEASSSGPISGFDKITITEYGF
jgi:hypothetical protein